MPDGELVFGSRIERGLAEFSTLLPSDRMVWFLDCKSLLSSILALDFFVANDDRHQGNFLFHEGISGRRSCFALDFSRALFYHGWPVPAIWLSNNNTMLSINTLKHCGAWDANSAAMTLSAVSSINLETWKTWVNVLPNGWITDDFKAKLSAWWGSPEFHGHLQACMSAAK